MVCDEFSFSTGDEGQGTLGCSPYREFYPDEENAGDSGWWEEPAIHNFIFVHDSYNGIMKVKKGLDILQFILNPLSPIVVPQRQMDDFIRLYESDGYDEPEFLTPQTMGQLRKNARVVIGDGPLAGISGYYQRVKGAKDKRFIVLIEGLIAMACSVECKFVKEK